MFYAVVILIIYVTNVQCNVLMKTNQLKDGKVEVICSTNDSTKTMTIVTPITSYNPVHEWQGEKAATPQIDFYIFRNTQAALINYLGPVLDRRWERFKTVLTQGRAREHGRITYEQIVTMPLLKSFEINLSIRTDGDAHIFICKYSKMPFENDCFWFILGDWEGKKSVIRKCKRGSMTQDGQPINECKENLAEAEGYPLSANEWGHFTFEINQSVALSVLGKNYMKGEDITYNSTDKYTSVYVSSWKYPGLWKLHDYNFHFTENKTEIICKFKGTSICISMFVYICRTCGIKLYLTHDPHSKYHVKNPEPAKEQWSLVTYRVENLPDKAFEVMMELTGPPNTQHKFDNATLCDVERRLSTIVRAQDRDNVSCGYLQTNNHVITTKPISNVSRTLQSKPSGCECFPGFHSQNYSEVPINIENIDCLEKNETSMSLRWRDVYPPTGQTKHFTIIIKSDIWQRYMKISRFSHNGAKCNTWPGWYCNTIGDLENGTDYHVTITAKNLNISNTKFIRIKTELQDPSPPQLLDFYWDNFLNFTIVLQHPNRTSELITTFVVILNDRYFINVTEYNLTYTRTFPFRLTNNSCEILTISTITVRTDSAPTNTCVLIPPAIPYLLGELELLSIKDTSAIVRIPEVKNLQEDFFIMVLLHDPIIVNKLQEHERCLDRSDRILVKIMSMSGTLTIGDNTQQISEIFNQTLNNSALNTGTFYLVDVVLVNKLHNFIRSSTYTIRFTTESRNILFLIPILIVLLTIFAIGYLFRYVRYYFRKKTIPALRKLKRYIGGQCRHVIASICASQTEDDYGIIMDDIVHTQIYLSDIPVYVKEAMFNGELERQYTLISKKEQKPCFYGERAQNKPKNLNITLPAYDHSRVKLKKLNGDSFSDYINGNYIKALGTPKSYIATQNPNKRTCFDFWRMIWDENVKNIVSLTHVTRNGEENKNRYWPFQNEVLKFGDITVKLTSADLFPNYEYNSLTIKRNSSARQIELLHFTSWKNNDVPNYIQDLIPFVERIFTLSLGNEPIVIQGSAGAGRTGTVILIDICLRALTTQGSVNILNEFRKIREQRVNLVENAKQYQLVHLVVMEYFFAPKTIACSTFLRNVDYILTNEIGKQLIYLQENSWQDCCLSETSEYITPVYPEKMRFLEVRTESYGCINLSAFPVNDERTVFINAVLVDGFMEPKKFIATQQPMPNTVTDFWRMVVDNKTSVIVNLHVIDFGEKSCCEFWPRVGHRRLIVNNSTTVAHNETRNLKTHQLITVTLVNGYEERKVTIISLGIWSFGERVPNDTHCLLAIWKQLNNTAKNKERVVVTCRDGVEGCGLFIAMCFVLEKIKLHQVCDVYQAVKIIRKSNGNFIRSKEQYIFLYRMAQYFLDEFENYSNFENKQRTS